MGDDQDDTAAVELDSGRLCGYSGCRAPLPVSTGPGNRARYCQDGRTWGDRAVTCKQAGHAEDLLASINAPVAAPSTAVAELTGQIDALLDPAHQLVDTLEQVRGQLETEAVEARRERDEALRSAAHERGLREIAEHQTAEAARHADEYARTAAGADAERDTAVAEADRAASARQEAEHARLRAEARADELSEQLRRTDERLQAATGYAEDVDRKLAGTTAEITELRSRLEEERSRSEAERTRADQLVGENHRHLEELRAENAERLADLRRDHERERAALAERHEAAVAELYEQLGRRKQQAADERDRAESLRQRVEQWRSELADLIGIAERAPVPAAERERDGEIVDAVFVEPDLITRMRALLGGDSR